MELEFIDHIKQIKNLGITLHIEQKFMNHSRSFPNLYKQVYLLPNWTTWEEQRIAMKLWHATCVVMIPVCPCMIVGNLALQLMKSTSVPRIFKSIQSIVGHFRERNFHTLSDDTIYLTNHHKSNLINAPYYKCFSLHSINHPKLI